MNPTPTRVDKRAANADGYTYQATERPDGTIRWQTIAGARGVISEHDTEREADATAVAAWLLDQQKFIDEQTAYAADVTEDRERDAANRAAAEAANRLIPDADPITYEQGLFWWKGTKFLALEAAVAHARVVAEESRRQHDFEAELSERAEALDIVTELHEGDHVDRRTNMRAPWLEQVVDVYRPATAGNLPLNDTVEIVDGRVKVYTCTRKELAIQLGVPLPETEGARARREAAIAEARRELADRAEKAKAEAEKAAMALHHATL